MARKWPTSHQDPPNIEGKAGTRHLLVRCPGKQSPAVGESSLPAGGGPFQLSSIYLPGEDLFSEFSSPAGGGPFQVSPVYLPGEDHVR